MISAWPAQASYSQQQQTRAQMEVKPSYAKFVVKWHKKKTIN
jgi:hypothetical protein